MLDMTKRDEFFRERLLRDYDRLIGEIELMSASPGKTFCMFITPMDGRLIVADLRAARERAQSEQPDLTEYEPTSFGDEVADRVRRWYEENRESWWDRHQINPLGRATDRSGAHADEFILRLVAAVAKAERDLLVEIRTVRAAASGEFDQRDTPQPKEPP